MSQSAYHIEKGTPTWKHENFLDSFRKHAGKSVAAFLNTRLLATDEPDPKSASIIFANCRPELVDLAYLEAELHSEIQSLMNSWFDDSACDVVCRHTKVQMKSQNAVEVVCEMKDIPKDIFQLDGAFPYRFGVSTLNMTPKLLVVLIAKVPEKFLSNQK